MGPWRLSSRSAGDARAIADRHYNRQKHGSRGFVPPGRCLVLMARDGAALWVTSWPFAEFTKHAWAGAWINSLFRNEGTSLSSELIVSAVAATRYFYGEAPSLGMVTFVDAGKVRRKRDPGRCYVRAGFERVGHTQGGLVALQMTPDRMPEPYPALGTQRLDWEW
jgi:hypothetical protein